MKIISKTLEFNSKNLKRLMEILSSCGMNSRIIGGCVRDNLLGLQSQDIDIAAPIRPEEVISLLAKHKIKTIPTGLNFGTVTALVEDETFEITSLRRDIKCDGRHAIVEFTDDFELDAARRDFTINALSYSFEEGKLYDYFNGIEDLKKEKVVFIGDPAERIKEDYLRILRFFRFSARYSNQIDHDGFLACIKYKDKLAQLPRERINVEMDKMLGAKNAATVLKALIDAGVDIMGGLELNPLPVLNGELSLPGLYAILLFKNNAKILNKIIPSLRFSKKRKREMVDLVTLMQKPPAVRDFIELWVDAEDTKQYLAVALNLGLIKENEAMALKHQFAAPPPALPVKGEDLQEHFEGYALGEALLKIKKAWIDSNFTADKSTLMSIL